MTSPDILSLSASHSPLSSPPLPFPVPWHPSPLEPSRYLTLQHVDQGAIISLLDDTAALRQTGRVHAVHYGQNLGKERTPRQLSPARAPLPVSKRVTEEDGELVDVEAFCRLPVHVLDAS